MALHARFDDRIGGTAVEFVDCVNVIEAHAHDEVMPALRQVEEAQAKGLWAAGFVTYEAAPAFDEALTIRERRVEDPFGTLPLLWFGLFRRADKVPLLAPRATRPAPYSVSTWTPSITKREHRFAIDEIHERIGAGDTYQVNHTFRLQASFSGVSCEMYHDMALSQGAAYSAHFCTGRYEVCSASPELFFEMDGADITVRPMKGTAPRGRWPEEDAERAEGLRSSRKDQSENLIIVDLLRNDLGRVADFGSVQVDRMFDIERFGTVWQMTSTIKAKTRGGCGVAEVFTALFPCGSVTGAPKARTMELIFEIEDSPRGVYCGAIGFAAPEGAQGPSARFSVGIRTVTIDRQEGIAEYGVGGGVVWDSDPEGEYTEARAKAQVLVARLPEFELLETIRSDGDDIWWLDRHLDRMEGSARYFGFEWDRSAVAEAIQKEASRFRSGANKLRVSVSRTGDIAIEAAALEGREPHPVVLTIDPSPVNSDNVFLFHKTTNRREYDVRAALYPGADDVPFGQRAR